MAREYIEREDLLNQGRVKLNKSIDKSYDAEANSLDAKNIANQSTEISNEAKDIAANTNERLNNVLASEMKDGEVIDFRKSQILDHTFNVINERGDFWDKEFIERGVNVRWFGAKGDGLTDDTESINNAIKYAKETNSSTIIPPGVYLIKAHVDNQTVGNYLRNEGGIEILDNTTLVIYYGAKLKAIVNDKKAYNIIRSHRKENWNIILKGIIEGEADEHTGTIGEWGYGISVQGGKNFKIVGNGLIHKCWGDGINLQRAVRIGDELSGYYPENGFISEIRSDQNGRQGISIEEGKNIIVKDSVFSNTYRIAPKFGICIEPAWRNEADRPVCEDIIIDNCDIIGNEGGGIAVVGTTINDDIQLENITVKNCRFSRNNSNTTLKTSTAISCNRSDININNCKFDDNQSIYIASCREVDIRDIDIKNGTIVAVTDKTDKYNIESKFSLVNSNINNNDITNSYRSVITIILNATDVFIGGNLIRHKNVDVELIRFTGENGIRTRSAKVINNTLIGGRTSIKHTWVDKMVIMDNNILDNNHRCLETNGRDVVFTNNNVINCDKGIFAECHQTELSTCLITDNYFDVKSKKIFTAYQPNVNYTLYSVSNKIAKGIPFTELGDVRSMSADTLVDLNSPKIATVVNNNQAEELPLGSLFLNLNSGYIMYKSFDGLHKVSTVKV